MSDTSNRPRNPITPWWEQAIVSGARSFGDMINRAPLVQSLDQFSVNPLLQAARRALLRDAYGIDPDTGERSLPGFGLGGIGATRVFDVPLPKFHQGGMNPGGLPFQVLQDPSPSDLRRLLAQQRKEFRDEYGVNPSPEDLFLKYLRTPDGTYAWQGTKGIHDYTAKLLGIEPTRKGYWTPEKGYE